MVCQSLALKTIAAQTEKALFEKALFRNLTNIYILLYSCAHNSTFIAFFMVCHPAPVNQLLVNQSPASAWLTHQLLNYMGV